MKEFISLITNGHTLHSVPTCCGCIPPRLHLQPGLTTLDMEPYSPASETFEVEQCHGNGGCQAAGFAPHMSRTWKNGWLFESFVGMATRHLQNSETLAEEGLFLTCEEEPFQFFSF